MSKKIFAHGPVVLHPQGRKAELVIIDLEVDVEGLARELGREAMRNKSGRSHIGGGMVRATVRTRKPVESA
jgi:hypothetical protein